MTLQKNILYKSPVWVELRDVDFTKKMKLSSLFSYFQETASLAAEDLGYGIDTLYRDHGVAWVLVRIRVEIDRMPEWNEKIFIETWPQEPGRVEFERDFIVRDQNGDILIRAISVWVIMDMAKRKLKRGDSIGIHYPGIIKERAINKKLRKLKDTGPLQEVYKKVIGYSDIDINGHLNNSKYVDYAMDCFPVENHREYEVKTLEINFLNESLPGETITLYRNLSNADANLIYIEGVNETSNKTAFKAQVEIIKR